MLPGLHVEKTTAGEGREGAQGDELMVKEEKQEEEQEAVKKRI